MDYLALAREKLGIDADKVLSHRLYDDHIVLVVDNGIAGCPKHEFTFDELEAGDAAEVEAQKVDALQTRLLGAKKPTAREIRNMPIDDIMLAVATGDLDLDEAMEAEKSGRQRVTLLRQLEELR